VGSGKYSRGKEGWSHERPAGGGRTGGKIAWRRARRCVDRVHVFTVLLQQWELMGKGNGQVWGVKEEQGPGEEGSFKFERRGKKDKRLYHDEERRTRSSARSSACGR